MFFGMSYLPTRDTRWLFRVSQTLQVYWISNLELANVGPAFSAADDGLILKVEKAGSWGIPLDSDSFPSSSFEDLAERIVSNMRAVSWGLMILPTVDTIENDQEYDRVRANQTATTLDPTRIMILFCVVKVSCKQL